LRSGGVEVEELTGTDADDLRRLVRHALGSAGAPETALVVVGGDGMSHLGVGLVAGTGVRLGIIASGTGNDTARTLGLPIGDPVAAADVVLRGLREPRHQRPIDAVRCIFGGPDRDQAEAWFIGVLSAGFDALVNERANGWAWPRGRAKYVLAMLRELPVFRPRTYALELDGQRWSTAAMLVAVANGPSYGGGMRVAPEAVLDDGLLDVMLVRPLSRWRFLTLFPRVYRGTHVQDRRVSVQRGRRVVVDSPGIIAFADGERLGPLPLTCEIAPEAVIVLAPRAAETPAR
jgi:diacylglycerol kinase (ATP)